VDVMKFMEIEHKFVVGESFDLPRFRAAVAGLGLTRTFALRVRDRYFLTAHGRQHRYVIRHRYDNQLHHLTMKSLTADAEVRDEINLDLGQHVGDQAEAVDRFLDRLGVVWRGDVVKDIEVWEVPACELVYYRATGGDRVVHCVEFEVKHPASLEDARAVLSRYEQETGFASATRSQASLVDLLFPGLLQGDATEAEQR
jgi:hypothetical protein